MSADDETRNDASSPPEPPRAQGEGAARRTIDHIKLENFTAFRHFEKSFSPGINAFIGENATGKTHLLKLIYFACKHGGAILTPPAALHAYFFCRFEKTWNVVNFDAKIRRASYAVTSGEEEVECTLFDHGRQEIGYSTTETSGHWFSAGAIPAVLIPAKEMLSHNLYFRSTYEKREIYFEKQYVDILAAAGLGPLRKVDPRIEEVLRRLEGKIGGTVVLEDEVYYLKQQDGRLLEFTLVAEGYRRLGLIWLLLRNGEIAPGTVLLWDEPEANLNPSLIGTAIQVLLELQRIGVQVFFATHSYVALKELDLRAEKDDVVQYHGLSRKDGDIVCRSVGSLAELEPNDILTAYSSLFDRQVERALGGHKDEG